MTSLRTVWTPLAWVACVALGGCGITIPGNLDLDIDPSVTGAAGVGGSRPPSGGTVASVAGSWGGGVSGTSPGTAGSWAAGSWGGYAGTGAAGYWGGSAGTGVAGYWGGSAGAGVAGSWGGYAGGVAPTYPWDHDNDGWNEYSDCDDYNYLVNPGMMDACCDGMDSDCDGRDSPVGAACKCMQPPEPERDWDSDGYTPSQGDCDDTNWQVHPGQPESCDDGIDNDCNGWVDYQDRCFSSDSDRDGYPDSLDCDPWNANVSQGMGEICGDGIDNNCDGIVDGYPYCDSQPVDWDRDGYPYEKDCNDGDSNVFPGSPYEQCCDGIDSNCDGSDAPYNAICTCATPGDRDGDGYGIGMSDPSLADCNDQDATVHPNAYEDCGDKRDNNCNGFIDSADPGCQQVIID
jgi:hypothetical protein